MPLPPPRRFLGSRRVPPAIAKARLLELRQLHERDWIASTAEAARRILADHPRRAIAWLRLGDALRRMARFPEALAALRKALRLGPPEKRDLVCLHIGQAYQDRGSFGLAERWFRRTIELQPADTDWHAHLGRLHAVRGHFRAAAAAHRRAIRSKRGCLDEAFLNLGLVRRAEERYAEARQCFRRALALDPKYLAARKELADVDHVLARLHTDRKVSATAPRTRELRRLRDKGWVASTVEAARDVLKADPKQPDALLMMADSLEEMARYRESLAALDEIRRFAPPEKQHHVCWRLGSTYRNRGSFRLAAKWFQRAIELRPQNPGYRIFLGALIASRGGLRAAEVIHRRATRCKEGCVDEAFLNLGLVLRAQERYLEARKCFRRALVLDPKYREAREALADVEHVLARPRRPRARNLGTKAKRRASSSSAASPSGSHPSAWRSPGATRRSPRSNAPRSR